ncbi:ankyrin repeat domain-containing protein [Sphingomonas koreensis]|nr:ankyrin repeat domain-containing protein [Sphingomonas koreensis]TPG41444.1 ankyrin repeat domain-containing protein [Sphingomonas koreensis]
MISRRFQSALAAASILTLAAPAAAQLGGSDSSKFFSAIKDAKGQDVLDILAKPGTTIIDSHDPASGDGALHIVVKRGDATYTTFLLQHGADPNIRDRSGATPLIVAVNQNQEACLQILIDGKADVNLANDRGETPLILAVQLRNLPIVRDLLKAGADPDQADHMAGLSARAYAARDKRSPAIAKALADAPKGHARAAVQGPQL